MAVSLRRAVGITMLPRCRRAATFEISFHPVGRRNGGREFFNSIGQYQSFEAARLHARVLGIRSISRMSMLSAGAGFLRRPLETIMTCVNQGSPSTLDGALADIEVMGCTPD